MCNKTRALYMPLPSRYSRGATEDIKEAMNFYSVTCCSPVIQEPVYIEKIPFNGFTPMFLKDTDLLASSIFAYQKQYDLHGPIIFYIREACDLSNMETAKKTLFSDVYTHDITLSANFECTHVDRQLSEYDLYFEKEFIDALRHTVTGVKNNMPYNGEE